MKRNRNSGFTLIELLTVMAIIGILAGILIPAVDTVRKRANIAASKSQISGYLNAIQLFKGEYNYYPFPDAQDSDSKSGGATIETIGYDEFIGALSARDLSGDRIAADAPDKYGNRKLNSFHDFSDNDFLSGDPSTGKIADRFNNTNIFIAIDGNGDGKIEGLPNPTGGADIAVRSSVTAYVQKDSEAVSPEEEGFDYYLYE